MNLMTVFLQAAAQGGGASMMWIMMIAIFVIMYFFMIRPQSKKQKEINNFRKTIKVGQKVITAGGIEGESKELNDSYVVLESANGIKIKVEKSSVFADPADASASMTK